MEGRPLCRPKKMGRDGARPSTVKTILALETSCDETAVAILRGRNGHSGSELLASEVASQVAEHAKYGGIVPEIASRNHLEGHLLSPFFGSASHREGVTNGYGEVKPNVSLIVSGGHTMSIRVHGLGNYQLIGRTVDDAAGEAFDKVGKMLGLGYPGGPEIEKRARAGDPGRFDLPRSMLDSENFSFSGLKTAVRYLLPKLQGDFLADLCASFQLAVVEVLARKTIAAAQKYDVDLVTMSGGVSCNRELRRQLGEACGREGFEFKSAEAWLCTDNAAMIAFVALLRLQAGFESELTEEIDPNRALT